MSIFTSLKKIFNFHLISEKISFRFWTYTLCILLTAVFLWWALVFATVILHQCQTVLESLILQQEILEKKLLELVVLHKILIQLPDWAHAVSPDSLKLIRVLIAKDTAMNEILSEVAFDAHLKDTFRHGCTALITFLVTHKIIDLPGRFPFL